MTRLALPLALPLLDNRGAAAALAIGVLSISPAVLAQKAVAVATPQAVVPPEGEGGEKAAPTVQKPKEPRRFMMNGKLRTLKPGEVRPYVAPTLEADPAPEISQVKAVEVLEDEAQVLARPYYGAPMVGTLALGARIPVRGVLLGRGGRYCPERRWVALAPMGWICAKQAKPTKEAPSTDAVLQVPPGERLPFRYVMVESKEPLPLWATLEDFKEAHEPERKLERGDSVAIAKVQKWEGESYYVTVEGRVLPVKGTYHMGAPSAWGGVVLPEKPMALGLAFGWITPEKAKVFDSADAGRRIVETLARRTRVEILEEQTISGKRYLRVRPAAVLPGPSYPVKPGPPPMVAGPSAVAPAPAAAPGVAPAAAPGVAPAAVAPGAAPTTPAAVAPGAAAAPAALAAAAPGAAPTPGAAPVPAAAARPPATAPAPVPAAAGAPGVPPEPARWVLASDVNEVRFRKAPEGVNAVGRWINVDLGEQVLVAYEGERPAYATLVSSGRAVPTPMGNYPMWAKVSAITMKSQPYDDRAYFVNKVPWVLFFQAHNAIHGAYWHDRFGVSKSHGCVNVAPLDARHLFEWMAPAFPPGWSSFRPLTLHESPTIHVYNSQLKKPFRQDRPIGPPDKDDEAERLDAAERRRAEAAPPAAATPPGAAAPAAPGAKPAAPPAAPAAPGVKPAAPPAR